MRVLVIDNYDSFTFNLVQALGELGVESRVVKNDEIAVEAAFDARPRGLLVSPGPCAPEAAGISLEAIAQAFGARVVRAQRLMHGKTSPIEHDGSGIFAGLPSPFDATRYHSLAVDRASLPDSLCVSAWTADGEIMGLRHRAHAIEGVQFHPESILTLEGKKLIGNWVENLR